MAGFFERVKEKISGAGRKMKEAGSSLVTRVGGSITRGSRAIRRAGTGAATRVTRVFRAPPSARVRAAQPVGPSLASRITGALGTGVQAAKGGYARIKGAFTGKPSVSVPGKKKSKRELQEELERKKVEAEIKKIERVEMLEKLKSAGGAVGAGLGALGKSATRATEQVTGGTTAKLGDVGEVPDIGTKIEEIPPIMPGAKVTTTPGYSITDTGLPKISTEIGVPSLLGGEKTGMSVAGLEEGPGMSVKGMKGIIEEMTTGTAGTGKLGAFKVMEDMSVGTVGGGVGLKGTKKVMEELVGGPGTRVRSPFTGGKETKIASPFVDTKTKIASPFIETKIAKITTPFETMTVGKVSSPWFETTKGNAGVNIASIEKMLGTSKVKADFGIAPAALATGGITPAKVPDKVTGVNLNKIMEGMGVSTKVGTSVGDITKAPVRVAGMGGPMKLDTSMWGGRIDTSGMGIMMGGKAKVVGPSAGITAATPIEMAVPAPATSGAVGIEKVSEMVAVPKKVGMTGSLNIRGMEKMMMVPKQVGTSVDITRVERMSMGTTPRINLGAFDIKGAEKMIIKPMTGMKTPKIDVFATNGELKRIRKSASKMLLVGGGEEE